MGWTLIIGTSALALTLIHLLALSIPERGIVAAEHIARWVDVRGGWFAVTAVPGLLALVLFTTLNNFFHGAAMTVMDPYGIEMFGVEGWGIAFAVMSTGFILGGITVAARGLGTNPVRTMLLTAGVLGVVGALSTIREQGWLFIVAIWLFMALIPVVEAAEQTVIQKVVPYEKQGRVFGFANTFEAAAAPLTALIVAPIAELWIIPLLRTEEGLRPWKAMLGSGEHRGIALILLVAGTLCTLFVLAAFASPQYRMLSRRYADLEPAALGAEPESMAASEPEVLGDSTPQRPGERGG